MRDIILVISCVAPSAVCSREIASFALRTAMFECAPHLARLDEQVPAGVPEKPVADVTELDAAAFAPALTDYYFTNPIARASATMAACDEAKRERAKAIGGTRTDG